MFFLLRNRGKDSRSELEEKASLNGIARCSVRAKACEKETVRVVRVVHRREAANCEAKREPSLQKLSPSHRVAGIVSIKRLNIKESRCCTLRSSRPLFSLRTAKVDRGQMQIRLLTLSRPENRDRAWTGECVGHPRYKIKRVNLCGTCFFDRYFFFRFFSLHSEFLSAEIY